MSHSINELTHWGRVTHTLKRKCRHFDEILITGCTGSCHFDNFQCSQWWKFHQNEDISVSVIMHRKLSTIGSDNGLSPGRHQAIIWTNARILLIGHLGTNFSEMLIEIPTFSFKKMSLKIPAILSRPQFVDNILCHRTVDCLFEFFYLIEPWTWSSGALIWIPAWISNHIHYEVWEESIHKL